MIVLAHGVFDLLHAGHVEHLRQARAMGDSLVVSLVPDRFIEKERGTIYSEEERLALLAANRHVDIVELCNGPGPHDLIRKYMPNLYVRGSDYEGRAMPEDDVLRALGVVVRYTKSIPPRTTEIIQRIECKLLSS